MERNEGRMPKSFGKKTQNLPDKEVPEKMWCALHKKEGCRTTVKLYTNKPVLPPGRNKLGFSPPPQKKTSPTV